MNRIALAALAALTAGCTTIKDIVDDDAPDSTLAAINAARVRACPAGRTLENARIGSDNEQRGVAVEDVALVPLASDPSRALRLRRLTIAPGGVVAWHTHEANQGMALLVSGEATEFRNTCLDAIRYRAGDVAPEDAATAHGWRNESDEEPAVFLVMHVVER
jgi:quercetin dioxygenase-like cupin family protein